MNKFLRTAVMSVVVLFSLGICSCSSPNRAGEPAPAEPKDFYPIAQYIKAELSHLDTLPLAVIRYSTQNGITDTAVMDKTAFKKIAAALIAADISTNDRKDNYKETSFMDASLGTLSLNYTPVKTDAPVSQLNVLLQQDNTQVVSIYAETVQHTTDSTQYKKLLWTAKRSLQITTITRQQKEEHIVIDRYVWDEIKPVAAEE